MALFRLIVAENNRLFPQLNLYLPVLNLHSLTLTCGSVTGKGSKRCAGLFTCSQTIPGVMANIGGGGGGEILLWYITLQYSYDSIFVCG
jgi:hypothetical protein